MKISNKLLKEFKSFIKNGELSKWYYYLIVPFVPFILFIIINIFIIYKLLQNLKLEFKRLERRNKKLKTKENVRKEK